ncbi:MAG: flagellar motor switch protein FliN [Planctomycetota bacterium]
MADEHQTTPPAPGEDDAAEASNAADTPESGGDAVPDAEAAVDDTQDKLDATAAEAESGSEDGAAPTDDEAAALAAVQAAISGLSDEAGDAAATPAAPAPTAGTAADDANAQPFDAPEFDRVPSAAHAAAIDLLGDVNLNVTIELGRTRMLVEDVLRLNDGAVVELDKLAGDPVDVFVNGRPVARGEVLVLNDTFCVRINQILDAAAEIAAGAKQ